MPFQIANVGDSYGSGNGTGLYDLSEPGMRSSISGQHMAMTHLARERGGVNIINTAYSGNQLSPHIIKPNGKPGWQLQQVLKLSKGAPIDCLIISAGGNDMHEDGLSGLIATLMTSLRNPFTAGGPGTRLDELREGLGRRLETFSDNLYRLHAYLSTEERFRDTRVIYCAYPDSTRDEHGKHTKPPSALFPNAVNRIMSTLSKEDFEFAYVHLIQRINERIKQFCDRDSRYIFNDVEAVSRVHGYTSTDSWFVKFRVAEEMFTAFHPNQYGSEKIYRDTLVPILEQHFPMPDYALFLDSIVAASVRQVLNLMGWQVGRAPNIDLDRVEDIVFNVALSEYGSRHQNKFVEDIVKDALDKVTDRLESLGVTVRS